MDDFNQLIEKASQGSATAQHEIFEQAYQELHRIARARRRAWNGNQTMSTTVLVHEAYLKLSQNTKTVWRNKTHFYATAAQAMRHILVNYAQAKKSDKRGGGEENLQLEFLQIVDESALDELLEINDALEKLAISHPRHASIVECRFFGGMTIAETSAALDISESTVEREWRLASALLHQSLEGAEK